MRQKREAIEAVCSPFSACFSWIGDHLYACCCALVCILLYAGFSAMTGIFLWAPFLAT
jgi:hypothetical protein